jgi:hypothetical protein
MNISTKWFQFPSGFREEDIKQATPFSACLGLLILLCTSDQQQKCTFLPSLILIRPVVSEKMKNRQHPFRHLLLCSFRQHKLFIGPSNEHSYQTWFLLAQWFHSDHNVFQLKLLVSTSDVYGRNILSCTSHGHRRLWLDSWKPVIAGY